MWQTSAASSFATCRAAAAAVCVTQQFFPLISASPRAPELNPFPRRCSGAVPPHHRGGARPPAHHRERADGGGLCDRCAAQPGERSNGATGLAYLSPHARALRICPCADWRVAPLQPRRWPRSLRPCTSCWKTCSARRSTMTGACAPSRWVPGPLFSGHCCSMAPTLAVVAAAAVSPAVCASHADLRPLLPPLLLPSAVCPGGGRRAAALSGGAGRAGRAVSCAAVGGSQ